MRLIGSGGQQRRDILYTADGTVVTGGTPQVILGQSMSRSFLLLQNQSASALSFEIGSARATCTINAAGQVTGFTITNAGFNFTKPPRVIFLGGGSGGNSAFLGLNQPGGPGPSHPAVAHAVLTSGAVSSIVIDDPGAGYVIAPFVLLQNSDLDPYGCALPSATGGILLPANTPALVWNGTFCPTDPIAVFGATSAQAFVCRWAD